MSDNCPCGRTFASGGAVSCEDAIAVDFTAQKLLQLANVTRDSVEGTENLAARSLRHAEKGLEIATTMHEASHDRGRDGPSAKLVEAWIEATGAMMRILVNLLTESSNRDPSPREMDARP